MTDFEDEDYEVYEMSIDELGKLPFEDKIAPGIRQFNTSRESEAVGILEDSRGSRVQIYVHDSVNDMMYPLVTNAGHGAGISADYLLNMMYDDRATLKEELEGLAPAGAIQGEIDWFQINVLE